MANLNIADLDFDDIKENLKTYLKSQEEFSDYDFEGSGLSVLLDVLAYNTHYNAYLANMIVNESFLDSAVKRSSAVSIAKHLGYVPTSRRGSKAIVNVTVNNPIDNPTTLTLDRYTPFVTTVNGVTYTFLNIDPVTITPNDGVYSFNNVQVIEGNQLEISYVCIQPGPDEKFVIPNENVDTSTLLVSVQNSATDSTTTTFTVNNDVTGIDSTSNVYFLEENQFEQYQIYFGDGVLGKKLSVGNIIKIRYLITNGPEVNTSNTVAQIFTTSSIGGSSNVIISTASNPTGGSLKESISSIKFNATKFNAARNRAVTVSDYESLVTSYNPDIESIAVWGGEDNDPPAYGKVFISLKPRIGFVISDSTKLSINNFLKNKKILAIQPEFVDPVFYYLQLVFYVEFNSLVTTKSSSIIENIVRNTINNYFLEEVQKFNKEFNKGKLTKLILESDPSITSVVFEVKVQRRNSLILNEENSFADKGIITFAAPVVPGSLKSSRFYIINNNIQTLVSFSDVPDTDIPDLNGTGTIQLVEVATESVIKPSVGSINYSTGSLSLSPFIPTGLPNNVNDFRVTASVQEPYQNIKVNRNEIIVLDETQSNAAAGRAAGLTVNITAL